MTNTRREIVEEPEALKKLYEITTKDYEEKTKVVRNGNLNPCKGDCYVGEENFEDVVISIVGEDERFAGKRENPGIKNITNRTIRVKNGYETTANGSCDDVDVPPGGVLISVRAGNPYSFQILRVIGREFLKEVK